MAARGISIRRAWIAVTVVELTVLYLVLDQSSWAYDDNFLLVLTGQEGFTWRWLTSVQFEHWDVGWHVLLSLQHRLFFFDYRWALISMLGLLGGCIFLFERILATVTKRSWITLAFVAWFGLNILWVRPLQWWSAGSQYLPYTFFDLLCLYGFLRYHADGARRWVLISVAALAAALLFYEKPAYMLLYLVLLRVLLMSEDLHLRAVLDSFWRERFLWIAYVAVVAVWGAGYLHSHAYSSHGSVGLSQYLAYFRILWLQTLVPSLASVTIPASRLDTMQIIFVVSSQLAVLACVVVSLLRKRSAWRAWMFLAITIALGGILVAHSRVSIFGVDIASDPRYLVDYSWLVPLALCAAFAPETALRPVAPEPGARLTWSPRGAVVLLVTVILLGYAVGATASALELEKVWAGPQAREWEKRVRSGIAALERSGARPMVAENVTPFEVISEFVAPYNRLSRLLPLYVGPIQVDGPLDSQLVRIANDGTVHRATLVAADESSEPLGLGRSDQVVVGPGGRVVRDGANLCVIASATPVAVERPLGDLPEDRYSPYYLKLAYRVWQPVGVPIFVDIGAGYPGTPENAINLSPNAGSSIAWLGAGTPRRVELSVPPLTTLCMSRFDIVTLRNAS